MKDPIWAEWSAPVLAQIDAKPCSWPDLHAWRKKVRMNEALLRNCVAWLEHSKIIRSLEKDGHVRWISYTWLRDGGIIEPDSAEDSSSEDAMDADLVDLDSVDRAALDVG